MLIERILMAIEHVRVSLKEYALLDESTKKAVRHQVYSRTGDFGKAFFNPVLKDESLAALYARKEEELGMAPFVKDTITVHIKDGAVVSVSDLPSHMKYVVVQD